MQRRKFGREFKFEAVRLIKQQGVSVAQAARDLDVHENLLRKWVREFSYDPAEAFPGPGQMKAEQVENAFYRMLERSDLAVVAVAQHEIGSILGDRKAEVFQSADTVHRERSIIGIGQGMIGLDQDHALTEARYDLGQLGLSVSAAHRKDPFPTDNAARWRTPSWKRRSKNSRFPNIREDAPARVDLLE